MECQMAAHGSGAIALSRGHNATLLNVDIGGGTTKFALIEKGRILATCAIAVGGRLLVEDGDNGLTRIEPPVEAVAKALGIELALGQAAGAAGSPPHRRRDGAHRHGHDRSAPAGRAGALAARDRRAGRPRSPTRASTP
jgi:ethanolamine utilization protein EutA